MSQYLGPGSQRYLSRVFSCSRTTIHKGAEQVSSANFNPDYSYTRKAGAGRKKRR